MTGVPAFQSPKRGLVPVVDEFSSVLILGSLPGDESIRSQEYYANPRNLFWEILAAVYGTEVDGTYGDRLDLLRAKGVALWDVLQGAERVGSLDANIRREIPNDFVSFLEVHPRLRIIGFNGSKAAALFRKHVANDIRASGITVTSCALPSSSPTPGRNVRPLQDRVARWASFLGQRVDGAVSL